MKYFTTIYCLFIYNLLSKAEIGVSEIHILWNTENMC